MNRSFENVSSEKTVFSILLKETLLCSGRITIQLGNGIMRCHRMALRKREGKMV